MFNAVANQMRQIYQYESAKRCVGSGKTFQIDTKCVTILKDYMN